MKDGTCPKCAAATVHQVTALDHERRLALGMFTGIEIAHFICVTCGYVEQYVLSSHDRKKVAEKAQRVQPRSS